MIEHLGRHQREATMPKPKENTHAGGVRRALRRVLGRSKPADANWFDHPEMQARIAEAEADRREGRVTKMNTPEEFAEYLNSLA